MVTIAFKEQDQITARLQNIITRYGETLLVKKNEHVYSINDRYERIFFLKKGRVIHNKISSNGRIMSKSLLTPGEFFGEMNLLGQEGRSDFAIAKDEVELEVFRLADLNNILKECPDLYLYIMKSIMKKLSKTEHRLESLMYKNSRFRVIDFIYNLGVDQGQKVGYETLVRHFLTHQEISRFTATSRQTVTTILNELRSSNIITFNRRRLLIRDMDRLKKAAS